MSVFEDSDELLEDFKEESSSALEVCESALLLTEKPETFQEGYAEVFRAFHSIKGLSSMFGLDQIQAHFHHLESLLVKYKDQSNFPSELVDYLLSAVDAASKMIEGQNVVFDLFDPCESMQPSAPVSEPNAVNSVDTPGKDGQVVELKQPKTTKRDIVYVVDDEPALLDIYCELLSDLNLDIVPFTSAKEALGCLDSTTAMDHPKVIVSDLMMPEMDGKQFLEQIKKVNPDIPFVFLSGFLDEESLAFSLAQGAHGVLTKPANEVELTYMVKSAIAFYKTQKLVKKSLKFLFYFLSQHGSNKDQDKKLLEREILNLMKEMEGIKTGKKDVA